MRLRSVFARRTEAVRGSQSGRFTPELEGLPAGLGMLIYAPAVLDNSALKCTSSAREPL
jgi:hypothetical protein